MNWKDEIVEEVRCRRESYAAQFNYNIARIVEDLKLKEEARLPIRRADLVRVRKQQSCHGESE